jgi:hypothetical protein
VDREREKDRRAGGRDIETKGQRCRDDNKNPEQRRVAKLVVQYIEEAPEYLVSEFLLIFFELTIVTAASNKTLMKKTSLLPIIFFICVSFFLLRKQNHK